MDINSFKKTTTELAQDLAKLEVYAKDLEMERSQTTLHELNERIKNDHFNLAVLGEFRRGKSTLINALLRTPVLPSDIVPTTASVNRITYDAQAHAKVEYFDGTSKEIPLEELADYATQDGDKSEDVREVTVWYPTVYCSNNVDIYDTPGLNDSERMNQATMDVIWRMDVAIFTLSANVNFSMSECEFIGEKLLTSNIGRVVFVVTRMGEYTPQQQEKILRSIRARIEELVLDKAKRVLSDRPEELEAFERKLGDIQIFGVDSVMALEARKNYDAALLEKSGFPAFERAIDGLLTNERGRVMLERQTSAIMKSANDVFNVIQARMSPLTMDENEFAEKCENADKQIKSIQETMNGELDRLGEAAAQIKEQVRGEWDGYVDEIKQEIKKVADGLTIGKRDILTPKAKKAFCEKAWETQIAPAISRCLQVYSEKIQNSVSEAVGKECEKLESYEKQVSEQMQAFTQMFVPVNANQNNVKGQLYSFLALGLGGRIGYTHAGVKGAIVGGLSGTAATFAATFALSFVAAALGMTLTAPVTLAITAVAAVANFFTGKKVTQHLFWRQITQDLRVEMTDMACKQLDTMLAETNFARQVEDYVGEVFAAIQKELTTSTSATLQDMQKSLLTTRENFAAEKAQIEQKAQSYTAILESLSEIIDRTANVRRSYGLDRVAGEADAQ